LAGLVGADYNPRLMPEAEMLKLVRSIREFGFVDPVVARAEDGLVIGGHQRIAAFRRILREDGKDEAGATVPAVLLTGLSNEKTKLLNLALNKIHGEWDDDKLADVIGSLQSLGAQIDLSGFSTTEVTAILDEMGRADVPPLPEADATNAEADGEAERDAKARSRRFAFEVATDKDAEFCRRVLKRFGMDGPATGSGAFVKALRASVARRRQTKKDVLAAALSNMHTGEST
jgi:ParB-like chromosome segregation protein Spo0J